VLTLSQSSARVVLQCRGSGVEPAIEFDRPLVDFSPILPHSQQPDEQQFTIRNLCKFPVEIYNLEFDNVYLEEEKVSFFYTRVCCWSLQKCFIRCSICGIFIGYQFLGSFDTQTLFIVIRTTKSHFLLQKRVYWSLSVLQCDLDATQRMQKGKNQMFTRNGSL